MALFDNWDDFQRDEQDQFGASSPVSQLQLHDSFEDSTLDVGNYASMTPVPSKASETALMVLEKFETGAPAALRHLTVSGDVIAMALENGYVVRIDLSAPDDRTVIKFSQYGSAIHRIFMDPTASFLFVGLESGDNYFIHTKWKKVVPKPVSKLKVVVETIAWDHKFGSSNSTREVLVGTSSGHIYETILDEKGKVPYFKQIFDLNYTKPITCLHWEWSPSIVDWNSADSGDKSGSKSGQVVILAATSHRLYTFSGKRTGGGFESVFAAYEVKAQFSEVIGEAQGHSVLATWRRNPTSLTSTFAWTTARGIYHGVLDADGEDGQLFGIEETEYPDDQGRPIALTITEYHFVLLYENALYAISRLSKKVAETEKFNSSRMGTVLGLCIDPMMNTRWLYSDAALYELVLIKEDRNVWKLYLDKKRYRDAYRTCQNDAGRQEIVKVTQADDLYHDGKFIESARLFADTNRQFERVCLMFDAHREALKEYIKCVLGKLSDQDATQRTLLCTKLLEYYMHTISLAKSMARKRKKDKNTPPPPTTDLHAEYRSFVDKYHASFDRQTTFSLMKGFGLDEELLYYATVVGDLDSVMSHYLQRGEYLKAVEILSTQNTPSLVYRYSPMLMQFCPSQTVSSWISNPQLEPTKLLPSLVRYDEKAHPPTPEQPEYQDIRFLRHCVRRLENKEPAIHNMLVSLYAKRHDDTRLIRFLSTQGTRPIFDFNYALRVCTQHKRWNACILLYSNMGLFEEAVELALSIKDIALAKENSDRPEDDDDLRRKLWLKIAKHILAESGAVADAIAVIQESKVLKIEDILPSIPDTAIMDDFKDEICESLEHYSSLIKEMVQHMTEATRSSEMIRDDIKSIRTRSYAVMENQRCELCRVYVLSKPFSVFPCLHAFHIDCLVKELRTILPIALRKRLNDLELKMNQSQSKSKSQGGGGEGEEAMKEFNDAVSRECPLCGDLMVRTIGQPFVEPDDQEIGEWSIDNARVRLPPIIQPIEEMQQKDHHHQYQ